MSPVFSLVWPDLVHLVSHNPRILILYAFFLLLFALLTFTYILSQTIPRSLQQCCHFSDNSFVCAGADGSVRMFDLRHLEHSTIIYEDPQHHPLLRLAWNKQDPNYLATMAMDAMEVGVSSDPLGPLIPLLFTPRVRRIH